MFTALQQDPVPGWWPPLAEGAQVYSDPRWLELFARSRGETGTWWFAAGRGAEPEIGLRGTVVGRDTRKSMNPYRWLFARTGYHDREPFPAEGAPAPAAWFPALLCSYPGLDTYPVGAGEDPELVRLLLDGMASWAAEHGVTTMAIGFVQPERAGFAAGATSAGFHPLPVATRATLPLAGRSAEQVFATYSSRQRNNMRRIRRRVAERGVRVERLPRPLDELETLVELRCAHARQHGKEPDAAEERDWLGSLLRELPDRATVYGALRESRLRGFSLFVDDGQWWTAVAVARSDPEDDRDVYFELNYYRPIEDAAAAGIAEISFGYGTEDVKRQRGSTLVRVPTWYRGADPSVGRWLADNAAENAAVSGGANASDNAPDNASGNSSGDLGDNGGGTAVDNGAG